MVNHAAGRGRRIVLGAGRSILGEHGEVVGPIVHNAVPWPLRWPLLAMRESHARTDSGFSKWPLTSATTRPTEKPKPPNCERIGNTGSSVVSSPMKIGLRPLNSGYFINSPTGPAFLMPGNFVL